MQPLMNMQQLAEFLGVPTSWVRDKLAARAIPVIWIGKHARWGEHEIQQILDAGREQPLNARPAPAPLNLTHPPAGPSSPPPPPRPGRPSRKAAA